MYVPLWLGLAAALMLAPASALGHALGPCGPRPAFLKFLAGRYDEAPAARGLTASGGQVIELVASRNGESWTIIVTDTRGTSCGLASGKAWQPVTAAEPIEPPA